MLRFYKLRDYNFRLVVLLVILSGIGVLLVNSADSSLRSRQMAGVLAGLIVMVVISLLDYSWIANFYRIIYILNLIMLLLVLLTGSNSHGATRWIEIGSFQFQPTELSKILLILFFSMYFMKHEETLNDWRTIFHTLILAGIPLALVLAQPDLKNTITISILIFILYFMAGLDFRKIAIILAVIVAVVGIFLLLVTKTNLPIMRDYQRERIMTFLEPENDEYSDSAIQQTNSITAIGSGQLTGKGLNNNKISSSNKGNFVSELQNDFIFAVAGEELGFVGCLLIIALLFFIVMECLRMGRRAKDLSGTLICTGVGSLVAVQSFINIAVATGLFPNTGTPLPFVSYGLTSLLCMFIGMGLVLNVGLQNRDYYLSAAENPRFSLFRKRRAET